MKGEEVNIALLYWLATMRRATRREKSCGGFPPRSASRASTFCCSVCRSSASSASPSASPSILIVELRGPIRARPAQKECRPGGTLFLRHSSRPFSPRPCAPTFPVCHCEPVRNDADFHVMLSRSRSTALRSSRETCTCETCMTFAQLCWVIPW